MWASAHTKFNRRKLMSTYPVDIKSTTAATIAVHNALGTGAPGRALGLFVSKEGGQGVTTVKIKDNTTLFRVIDVWNISSLVSDSAITFCMTSLGPGNRSIST